MSEPRIIKRYGSRKLYDARESRYVSLEEIGGWIRAGEEVRVLDNETSEDVTAWTLTQILSEDGKRGRSVVPSALLHDIIRLGGRAVRGGMEHLRTGMDRVLEVSLERLGPVSEIRAETARLRRRLDDLEAALGALEHPTAAAQATEPDATPGDVTRDDGKPQDEQT